jgi:hypothetical protein
MMRRVWTLTVFIVGMLSTMRAEAIMVLPVNVEELARRADRIFVGTCTNVEAKMNAHGIPVVEVTYAVTEGLKGNVGETVTFQQLDTTHRVSSGAAVSSQSPYRARSIWEAAATSVKLPTYTKGEKTLLFLARPGQKGVTAPIGLFQGKLPISTSTTGGQVITNTALKNTALKDVALPEPGKPAQYEHFLTALRTIVQPQR